MLDFGRQPLSNRYLSADVEEEFTFPFALVQCVGCGTVQLATAPPADELRSRFSWITYNEPESHLDDVVQRVLHHVAVGPQTTCAGVSYKDDTTLDRFARRGLRSFWRIDVAADLGGAEPNAGLETIQERLTPAVAATIAARNGPADVVVVRHILEHAHAPAVFLAAIRNLSRPDGHVIFEVPDCTRGLDLCDYSMPWEEHVSYFTPTTFRRALEHHGYEVVALLDYPSSHENSLVAVCRILPPPASTAPPAAEAVTAELARGDRYAREFSARQLGYRMRLESESGKTALFGAGHLSATFVNLLGIADLVSCCIDDNPHKQGLLMPGSRLPIVSSAALDGRDISLCLLSVRPEVEPIVRAKHGAFTARGGSLQSIFPGNSAAVSMGRRP